MTRGSVAILGVAAGIAGMAGVWSAQAAGRSSSNAEGAAALPFYGSADLTPRWAPTDHRIAPFSVTTQSGAAFNERDLDGRVYVASFIYTRCTVQCPRLVSQLKRVAERISDPRFRILSFTVTPDLDTPSVLEAFGRERRIDAARWKLLTGSKRGIYDLARTSYFASDERLSGQFDADALLHTERFTLVDEQGRIRGVYNGTQPADIDHLVQDANVLLRNVGTRH